MFDGILLKGWKRRSFSEAVLRLQSKGGKVKTEEYKESAYIPVVDQGRALVAAYTDKRESAFQGPYPVVVFGDHTRNVKFLDFNFAVGGDGVVLLRPKDEEELDTKFLCYWLKHVPLHNLGYSRHFKIFKDKEISYPIKIEEQRRIVSRIDGLICHTDETRRLSLEIEDKLDLLLRATYYRMIEDVEWKPLNEVASLVRRGIHIKPDEEYEEMGVRSFGKGTFRKPILTGRQIGSKRIYRIHEGDLVFNNVFAWEGAIAVAQPEDHGRVGSHRFITYVPQQGKATSEFLCHHFLSEKGLEDICAASPGSAGRNRTLGLEKLKIINVPVPNYQKQLGFAEIAKRRRQVQFESASIKQELLTYETAVIAKAFRGEL